MVLLMPGPPSLPGPISWFGTLSMDPMECIRFRGIAWANEQSMHEHIRASRVRLSQSRMTREQGGRGSIRFEISLCRYAFALLT